MYIGMYLFLHHEKYSRHNHKELERYKLGTEIFN